MKQIIEIKGVKMEVDLREATTIESYRVGDNIKILKKSYGDNYTSHAGVIVGFDAFKNLPTIVICYFEGGYDAKVSFAYLNENSADIEICPMGNGDIVDKQLAEEKLNQEIIKAEAAVADLKMKRDYFLKNFNKFFEKQGVKEA